MGLVFPILGAVGIFLVVTSLFSTPPLVATTSLGARLSSLSPALWGEEVGRSRPALDRLVQVLFGGAGEWLGRTLNRRAADEMRLRLAGWPRPYTSVESFYIYKVAIAVWMGVVGLISGSVLTAFLAAMAPLLVPLAVIMATAGFLVPDLAVSGAATRRREQTIAEMSSALGRLATITSAGTKIDVALGEIAGRPGGPFIRELRQVAVDYGASGDLGGALDALAERYPLREIVIFAGRVKAAREMGGNMSPTLNAMASDASEKLNLILQERAGRNTLLMIAPIGMAVTASLAILIAPGAVTAIQMFTSGM